MLVVALAGLIYGLLVQIILKLLQYIWNGTRSIIMIPTTESAMQLTTADKSNNSAMYNDFMDDTTNGDYDSNNTDDDIDQSDDDHAYNNQQQQQHVVTAIDFDETGNFLAVGLSTGVVLVYTKKGPVFSLYIQFCSHETEVVKLKWCKGQCNSMMILVTSGMFFRVEAMRC